MRTRATIETISVHASASVVAKYQCLLVEEWSRDFPQEVLSVLWAALGKQTTPSENQPLFQLLDPMAAGPFPTDYFRSIAERIADSTKFIRRIELPEVPQGYVPARKPTLLVWQGNRLVTWLTLPAHVTVTGDGHFFADLQALVFQAAIHFVLPALREKYPAEHALLLHSAVLFAVGYSAYDPGHEAYMMSMIYKHLGDDERRLRSLYAAFRFTAPHDHSYLTKAQEFWMELLDASRHAEAEQFLFSLPWWTLPTQQDEVRAMIADAYKHILKSNHHHP